MQRGHRGRPRVLFADPTQGQRRRHDGRGTFQGGGHEDGTATVVPARRPGPLICTRVSEYRPVLTGMSWLPASSTTVTAYPPPGRASRAETGTARTSRACWVVMATLTGAELNRASSRLSGSPMVAVTVAGAGGP